jgi:hypothetical protein
MSSTDELRQAEADLSRARDRLDAHEARRRKGDPDWDKEWRQYQSEVGEAFREWRAIAQGLA